MKKIIITLSLILLSFFGFIQASAQIMPNNPTDYVSAKPINEGEGGNVIKGINSEEEILNSIFYQDIIELYNYVYSAKLEVYIVVDMEAYNGDSYTGELFLTLTLSEDKSIRCTISYYVDDVYDISIVEDNVEIHLNETVNLNDIVSDTIKKVAYSKPIKWTLEAEYKNNYEEKDISFIYDNIFSCLYSIMYKRNEYYIKID